MAKLGVPRRRANAPATRDLTWMSQGLCAQIGDDTVFFPEKGGSTKPARRVCRACPVQTLCLEYALAFHPQFGIWGGTTEDERRRINKGAQP